MLCTEYVAPEITTDEGEKLKFENDQWIHQWRKTHAVLKPSRSKPQQKKVVEKMQKAGTEGDLEVLRSFVKDSEVNPNLRDANGLTVLHCAAKAGKLEAVRFLCMMGADIDSTTNLGNTALMKAAEHNHPRVVFCLSSHGADMNVQNNGGATALMMAIANGSDEGITALLKAGANVNIQKDTGYTALMLAARNGKKKYCSALLRAGADLHFSDNQGENAVQKAVKSGNDELADMLSRALVNQDNTHLSPRGTRGGHSPRRQREQSPRSPRRQGISDRFVRISRI